MITAMWIWPRTKRSMKNSPCNGIPLHISPFLPPDYVLTKSTQPHAMLIQTAAKAKFVAGRWAILVFVMKTNKNYFFIS